MLKLYLDSADFREIEYFVGVGAVCGITTNATVLRAAGVTRILEAAREIVALAPRISCSFPVLSDDPESAISEGRLIGAISENVEVKVPVISQGGRPNLDIIHTLSSENIRVNATCCFSVAQGVMAAQSGASTVSILWGRIEDEGLDPARVVSEVATEVRERTTPPLLLGASIRTVGDLRRAMAAPFGAITVPPLILRKFLNHSYARATVGEFLQSVNAGGLEL